MDVRDLGSLALALAVAGIIISFTLLVQTEISEEMCSDDAEYVTGYTNSVTDNPVTGSYDGCCLTTNTTGGSTLNCTSWEADQEAFNASYNAVEGVAEFSGWFVIIALALIFSIILGVIIRNIAGAGGGRV